MTEPRALILVDIQQGFDDPYWGARNNPGAETNAAKLLNEWRARSWPVFFIQHLSTNPDSPLHPDQGKTAIHPLVAPLPGEPVLTKSVNSAFIGTTLEQDLRAAGITALTICGLTTPHCVSTTARMAANMGFQVDLVHDACAAVTANVDPSWRNSAARPDPKFIHQAALDQLNGEFARVIATHEALG
ncbi:cysteine hydrolase family protein [Aliiroseovarius subalbicans]|uniref:cysteine hydrolase family protein n=1 Tax=Aliiroseovarius subalbicans TaxID=2925840 RepID=UPI001F597BFC|nr:cysteine hydrolase family protein [Aliiroseovarius subalbicans]MCI2398594.1 cysteine hydrolase [Aliiroseovarius subalbicans]